MTTLHTLKRKEELLIFDIYPVREVLPDGIKGYILDEKTTYAGQAKLQKYIRVGDRYFWVDKSPKEIEKTLQKTTKITKGSHALILDNFNPDLYNLI
jgi:hypothetical protein